MLDLTVPDNHWASTILPKGVLDHWLVSDSATAQADAPIATIRAEEALYELMAPVQRRLTIAIAETDIIDPETLLARPIVDTKHPSCH